MTALAAVALTIDLVPGPGARLHEYGISLRLPAQWHGVLFGPRELGPPAAVELQLATFPFSRRRGLHYMWDLGRPLRPNDLHIVVADYGRVRLVRRPSSWSVRLPLRIRASDIRGPLEGVPLDHGAATRVFLIAHHQLQVWVEFGQRHPATQMVAHTNALLRKIYFAKSRWG